jgi:hypothetical protein
MCTATSKMPGYNLPSGNPDDYGMCGILYLWGNFELITEARVAVVGNGYEVRMGWSGGSKWAPGRLQWTCAHFTEFSGVPPAARAEIYQPAPVAVIYKQIGAKRTPASGQE